MTSKSRRSMWYLDSGCSRHMTGDKRSLRTLKRRNKDSSLMGITIKEK